MAQAVDDQHCNTIHDLIPAYCLGATDPQETQRVADHLTLCREAAALAADFQGVAEALLFSPSPLDPPAALTERLRAATAATAAVQPGAAPAPSDKAAAAQQTLWQRLRAALAVPAFRPLPVMAAIALVALTVGNLYLVDQIGGLRTSVAAMQDQMRSQTAVLTQVGEGTNIRVALPAGAAGAASEAYGAMVCDPAEPEGFLLAENLPSLEAGQTYQIWLAQGETLVSGGLFQPDADGYGRVVLTAPLPMGEYDALRVTVEPVGGSDQPTTPPVIGGPLYGAQY